MGKGDEVNRIISKIKYTFNSIFKEISVAEYISWWVVRVLLIWAIIACPQSEKIMISINFLALFAMSLLRFLASKDGFASRISFRCQHIINIIEFLGTFLHNFLNVGKYIDNFDRILHVASGPLVVIAGYYILKACCKTEEQRKIVLEPRAASLFCCGFSFIVICLWEFMEFFGDLLFGSTNQGYNCTPSNDEFWYIVFNRFNAAGAEQYPLWDTMFDMFDAAITTAIATVIMYLVLRSRRKKIDTQK